MTITGWGAPDAGSAWGVQTTLLRLAVVIVTALVAALVGPLLIGWGNYRSLFEAEASRLIGVNVSVTGAIEARLLPSPQLTLHDIAIGDGRDTIRARSLGVEFALGALMRGEWRATEIHFAGPQVNLGLDASGYIHTPNLAVAFKPDELSVDRLSIDDGTVILADAASGSSITLGGVWFKGTARSLIGPFKGEGAVTVGGTLYRYRIATGGLNDERELKLRIAANPVDHQLSIEVDGALTFAAVEPRFDGILTLSRPVGASAIGAARKTLTQPWRVRGRIKGTRQSALIEDIEFQYGSEEQGFKLTGVADFKFWPRPHFDGVMSGGQINLDRVMSGTDAAQRAPAAAIRQLAEVAAAFHPALPVRIGLGIDQVTLGGNKVENLRGDISSGADGWELDRLEFRAPDLIQVRLSGRLNVGADGLAFIGPAEIDAFDTKMLAAWLQGRVETPQGVLRPTRLRGNVTLAGDKVAVEGLKAEFDRNPVTGRFAYFFPSGKRPARLDAELKAPQFDIDTALDFGKALLAGSALERPREISITVDIDRATLVGIEARDAHARVKIDPNGLQLDRLSVGNFAGGSFLASGRVETGGHAPRGTLSLDFEAKETAVIAALARKFAPKAANPIISLLDRVVDHAKLHATLEVTGDGKSPVTVAQLALAGDLDDMRIDADADVRGDWTKPSSADVRIDGAIDAVQGAPLVKLMGLDRIVAAGDGRGQLRLQLAGPANNDMTFDIRLSTGALSAQASGSGRFFDEQGAKVAANLEVMKADLRPLRPGAEMGDMDSLSLQMSSRVAIVGSIITFDYIDAKLAGSSIRGHLAVDDAIPRRIDGTIEAAAADVPALISRGIGLQPQASNTGAAWNWSSEQFEAGLLGKFEGKVALKFGRAELLPRLAAREVKATLRFGKNELALENVTGDLARGRISGGITFHTGEDGLSAQARISLTDVDTGALLRPSTAFSIAAQPPVTGLLGLTAEVEGGGMSPSTLVGSLKGSGKIVLADGQITGLDPTTFDAVTRAVDQGLTIESGHISDLVSESLKSGQLSITRLESAMNISGGQVRLGNVAAKSEDAELSIAGTLDLSDGSIDVRLVLSGSSASAGARPKIFIALKGPMRAPSRRIDVSALSKWLTLRAAKNQTKQLREMPRQSGGLPVRPALTPPGAGQPETSVGSQN